MPMEVFVSCLTVIWMAPRSMMSTPILPGVLITAITSPVPKVLRLIIPRPVRVTRATPNVPPSNGALTTVTPKPLNPVMTSARPGFRKTSVRKALTSTNPVSKTPPRPVRTKVMSTTVPVPTRPKFANGILLLPNAATIPNQTDVPRTRKSPAVKTARLSDRTPAVMTVINVVKPPVRPVMPIPMKKPPAARADISKTGMTTVCTARAGNCINGKKTPVPVMTSVRPMAELITGIIVIRGIRRNIRNV